MRAAGFPTSAFYLRLARERFSFEVCAAPFGTGCISSRSRYIVIPRGGWIALLILLFIVNSCSPPCSCSFITRFQRNGWFWIGLGIADVVAIVVILAHRARRDAAHPPDPLDRDDPVQEMPDFDAIMLSLPVIGDWWERVRKETYYRHDTRLMFQTIVSEVVEHRVNELVAARA